MTVFALFSHCFIITLSLTIRLSTLCWFEKTKADGGIIEQKFKQGKGKSENQFSKYQSKSLCSIYSELLRKFFEFFSRSFAITLF